MYNATSDSLLVVDFYFQVSLIDSRSKRFFLSKKLIEIIPILLAYFGMNFETDLRCYFPGSPSAWFYFVEDLMQTVIVLGVIICPAFLLRNGAVIQNLHTAWYYFLLHSHLSVIFSLVFSCRGFSLTFPTTPYLTSIHGLSYSHFVKVFWEKFS